MDNRRIKYYLAYKPYGMLNQFTDKLGRSTLAQLYNFPKDIYSVGRLDMDSEGLIFLSNDKTINQKILSPEFGHEKEYLVQVEGVPRKPELELLEKGVVIENKVTLPSKVRLLENQPALPERIPPIRQRKNIPTSWISVTLIEGRNRQVRKMTAYIGYPTLRLIRIRIGSLLLENMKPGDVKEIKMAKIGELFTP